MRYFIIPSTKDKVKEFERIRACMLRRQTFPEYDLMLHQMLTMLNLKDEIRYILSADPSYFQRAGLTCDMENNIAAGILEYELKQRDFKYAFELTNYIFYFLLLPEAFKCTFFLMQGVHVKDDDLSKKLMHLCPCQQYFIYKKEQKVLDTYLCEPAEASDLLLDKVFRNFAKAGLLPTCSPSLSNVIIKQHE